MDEVICQSISYFLGDMMATDFIYTSRPDEQPVSNWFMSGGL